MSGTLCCRTATQALARTWAEFVWANSRGGGEFGPALHEPRLKMHRQRIYDDFYAVAITTRVRKEDTSAERTKQDARPKAEEVHLLHMKLM